MKTLSITITLLSLSQFAFANQGKFETWRGSYDLKIEILKSNFNANSVSLATSSENGWTWIDESMKNVVNVFPIGKDLFLKMSSSVKDMERIKSDLKVNPSWKLDIGKTVFSWIEDSKKCDYLKYVIKHEDKLKKDGFKSLGVQTISENTNWNQLYINGKSSLSLSIRKDQELCHRRILFTENKI
ncbi:MAG: hypothetical protein EP326_02510 [Deltaproteobacteria bacterium]|nr:MAG: hypothetical protein EP326_02510 [Deltaproteobacteria bacterium]